MRKTKVLRIEVKGLHINLHICAATFDGMRQNFILLANAIFQAHPLRSLACIARWRLGDLFARQEEMGLGFDLASTERISVVAERR